MRAEGRLHRQQAGKSDGGEDACAYDARLTHDHQARVRPLMTDVRRLARWVAVYDGYVGTITSPERMAETILRLEIEVFGKPSCVGPMKCYGRIGEPIKIADWEAQYAEDRRATVAALTDHFEEAVGGLLREMA